MNAHETEASNSHIEAGAPLVTTPGQDPFLDYKRLDWDKIAVARYTLEQSFEYIYPGPIYDLRQRLIVIPPDTVGDQRLLTYQLQVSSPLAYTTTTSDNFGNRTHRIVVPHVDERIAFTTKMVIERDFVEEHAQLLSQEDALRYRQATYLTAPNADIEAVAQQLFVQFPKPEEFAVAASSWVYSTMQYTLGVTTIQTTATEALKRRQGLCQDYAHIMLAICRVAGFSARYVSGHLLGEGISHAWVEILGPTDNGSWRAIAIDPTNHRRKTPAYLTIAVGRDYADISPTTGIFTAPYAGQLHSTKHAGITAVELGRNR